MNQQVTSSALTEALSLIIIYLLIILGLPQNLREKDNTIVLAVTSAVDSKGDKEVVTVDFYVGSAPGGLTPVTTTPASTETTAEGEESEVYVNVTGSVVSVDPYGGTLIIDDKIIYFRGEFYNPSTGAYLEKEQVLASLSPGDYVTVVCKVTGAGRYMAEEVVLPNGTVFKG